MTQNLAATFYAKIGGLGTASGLYRFTTKQEVQADVPILLDVPSAVSSRMEPLQALGSDESITLRLAYETSADGAKIRPLVSDPSATPPVYSTAAPRSPIQLTEAIGPTTTSISLTSTVGLSTGTLYFLGGDALTFSSFPSNTTAVASRGVLSPFGGGFYHDARDSLGPFITSGLPTAAGQRVEFGRIVDGAEEVLFRGRIREEDGARLINGTVVELDVVSVSAAVRNAAISPPTGMWVLRGINVRETAANPIRYDGGIYIFSDDNGPSSPYVASAPGYIHVIDTETGDFATFQISGFGSEITLVGRPAHLVNVEEGTSLAAIGNKDGLLGLGNQTAFYGGGRRNESAPEAHLRFARDLIERGPIERLRVELAISADDLSELFARVLTSPSPAVNGMSAELPTAAVDIPAEVSTPLRGITNTLDGARAGFILPPFDAEASSTFRFAGTQSRAYRGRSRTLASVLEGTALKPFGLSLLTRSDGTVALVDWVTQAMRFDLYSLVARDLADLESEQSFSAGPTAPIIAVVPPRPLPLHKRGAEVHVSSAAGAIIVQSTRPVTSSQLQALETVETRHAVGDVAGLQEVAARMETAADLYALPRPELTATYLGGTAADQIEPGTFFTVTHPDVAGSRGRRGLTDARAVCIEKAVDVSSGSVTLRSRILGHSDQELSTWTAAGKIVSWSSPSLTLEANEFTDSDAGVGPTSDAQAFELDLPSVCIVMDSRGAVRGAGTVTARSGNVLTFSPAKGLVPAAGDLISFTNWGGSGGEWVGFSPTDNGGPPAFGAGLDDALGGVPGDPAQRYR